MGLMNYLRLGLMALDVEKERNKSAMKVLKPCDKTDCKFYKERYFDITQPVGIANDFFSHCLMLCKHFNKIDLYLVKKDG